MNSRAHLFLGLLLLACSLSACGGVESKLTGNFVNAQWNDVSLVVTRDTIAGTQGPMTVTAHYAVLKTENNVVTIEMTAQQWPKQRATVEVSDRAIVIHAVGLFNGTWNRK